MLLVCTANSPYIHSRATCKRHVEKGVDPVRRPLFAVAVAYVNGCLSTGHLFHRQPRDWLH